VTHATASPAAGQAAGRARAIFAGLTAAGLDARVHDNRGVIDITATWHRPGCTGIGITVDEDHYVQVSWRDDPAATPAQVVATIGRVLAAITTPP
jgi:hypothetical protein